MNTIEIDKLGFHRMEDEFRQLRLVQSERRVQAVMAVNALRRLIDVMGNKTGQSFKLRELLYSLWNGKPASLLDVVTLDWKLRMDLATVMLGFGYESPVTPGDTFYYAEMSSMIRGAGLWDWFVEERGAA